LLNALLSTLTSSGIGSYFIVSDFISTLVSSEIGSGLISSLGASYFFEADFPPFMTYFLGSGFGAGCFLTGAGEGTGGWGFLSMTFLLLPGLFTAEPWIVLTSFSLLVWDFLSPSSFFSSASLDFWTPGFLSLRLLPLTPAGDGLAVGGLTFGFFASWGSRYLYQYLCWQ